MRLRLMATYLGVPYQAGLGPDGTDVTLFSPGPPPDELGFTASGGYWRKQVGVMDLDALWQSRPVGEYHGEPCLVLDDLGGRLHVAYLGRDTTRAIQLGYWEIDREVFEVVVARQEVTGLTEERVDFPLAAAMFPTSGDPRGVPPEPLAAPEAAQALLWARREFRAKDLAGRFLVIAAMSSPKLHARIFREARRLGVLCNSVDDPRHCDFYYGSVVRRGEMQIAISTGGHSPSLAQRLGNLFE